MLRWSRDLYPSLPPRWIPLTTALGFVGAFLLVYAASYVHPLQGLNITPWNPPAALSVMLLIWRPSWWGWAWLALVVSDFVVRGPSPEPRVDLAAAGLVVAGHAAIAVAIVRLLGRPPSVSTRRDLLVLLGVIVPGALLDALLYVGALAALGDRSLASTEAVVRYWIGDAVGMLVTLPLLFVLGSAARRREMLGMLRAAQWWAVAGLAVASCGAVFSGVVDDPFKYFYLLFVPTVWAAARFGLPGASTMATVVQVLLILALQRRDFGDVTVFEFQLLMAALAGTALLLGATVDEREDTARSLTASLRLAAAGETAASLAHELNQPLAALTAYARASQLLAQQQVDPRADLGRPALVDVTDKMLTEAKRAGDVVRRLRDFFNERALQLEPTTLLPSLGRVIAARRARAEALGVSVESGPSTDTPLLWIDELQIEVVLRNLVDNAIDASAVGPAPRWMRVALETRTTDVLFTVRDSGAGVPPHRLPSLFVPQPSDKPAGMGIGLSLSRTIVEAHGGRLWAEPGRGGAFFMSLPLASSTDE